jgi:hypothetical protein
MSNGTALLNQVCTFGELDIASAETTLDDAGISYNQFSEYLENYLKSTDTSFLDIDICGQVYEFLFHLVCEELKDILGDDLRNVTNIYIYHNFMCTDFDNYKEANELAHEIPEDERSDLINWFISETE